MRRNVLQTARKKRLNNARLGLCCIIVIAVWLWPGFLRDETIRSSPQPRNAFAGMSLTPMGPYKPPSSPDPIRSVNMNLTNSYHQKHRITTYLLLGIDSRKGEPSRADTMLIAFIDEQSGRVALVSLPRDTRVNIPSIGVTKLNHAMAYGGVPLLKRTIENTLDCHIDHTMYADFRGFREVVDLLGGLDLEVEESMNYDDDTDDTHIHLQKGKHHLTGQQVLDYVRFRHDAEADTGRMRRQKQVVRAMMAKSTSFSQWFHLPALIGTMVHTVHSDVRPAELVKLSTRFSWMDDHDMTVLQIEGTNAIQPEDQLWYFYMNPGEPSRLRSLVDSWAQQV